ncbi:MAG: glycosyl hydrolase family 65 protein, partial [Acidimicrobiia bacterium]
RCSHHSSLSHAAFGMVATRVGQLDAALAHFRATASVDLRDANHSVVGGTFIGGIHTAACGGTYQLAVQGFGGLGFSDGRLRIDPALPPGWTAITYPVRWRGLRFSVRATPDGVSVTAADENRTAATLVVRGSEVTVTPGATVSV